MEGQLSGMNSLVEPIHTGDAKSNEHQRFSLNQPPPLRTHNTEPPGVAARQDPKYKPKGGLSNFGRLARGVGQKSKK